MPLMTAGELPRHIEALLGTREASASRRGTQVTSWPLGSPEEVLRRRRATRAFSTDPVPRHDLALIVDRARQAEQALWPAGGHGAIDYTILAAAFRITGLPPGLYRTGRDGDLAPLAAPWLNTLRLAYADAACLLLICADVTAACRAGGPGYGPLLVRAGTLGHGVWLAAIDLGLAGCVYAGPHHQVTGAARLAGSGCRHLFTASVGRAQPDPADAPGNGGGR
jgi:nitroreductase